MKLSIEDLNSKLVRILFMDDDDFFRDVLKQMLSQIGFLNEGTPDIKTMVKLYEQEWKVGKGFNLLLLNYDMILNTDVSAIVKEFKERNLNLKCIVFSSRFIYPKLEELHEMGYDNYLQKPFSLVELKEIIRNTIKSDVIEIPSL